MVGVADHEGMTTTQVDLSAAVELARLAPSVHNTQPWRFRVDSGALILGRDPQRQLAVMDPTGRQQTLSCGAALHLARLALRVQGYDTAVEYLPEPDDRDTLARLTPVPGHQVSNEDIVLERAAHTRHTQRGPFDSRALSRDVVAGMRGAAERHGAWVRWLDEPDDQVALTVLLARADTAERGDLAYLEELERWTARSEDAVDGLPATATPDVRGRASNLRLRNFSGSQDPAHPTVRPDQPPPAERPVVIVLGTDGDEAADWLRAGEALMAMLLRGTVDGVQAQPLGQVIDLEWSRARLAVDLGVVGCPQMVLRIGYGMPGADTPRRPVTDVLN